jgi:hypothetical protein
MTTPDAPKILQIPIGINAGGTRRETDFMGEIEVPADRYWGAQTAGCVRVGEGHDVAHTASGTDDFDNPTTGEPNEPF